MKKTILVVTNNLLTYEALHRAFRAARCNVLLAVNQRETTECCRTTQLDLVIVDLNWPVNGEADGREVARQVLAVHPSLPVVLISGRPGVGSTVESLGVAAVVEKPVDVPVLLTTAYELMTEPTHVRNNGSEHSATPLLCLPRNTNAFREALWQCETALYRTVSQERDRT